MNRPAKETYLRFVFLALAVVLFEWHTFIVLTLLRAPEWAILLFPDNRRSQWLFVGRAQILLSLIELLSVLTAIGLKRHGSWGRWTGIAASLLLVIALPWGTIAGALLLVLLSKTSVTAPPKKKFWDPTRQSGVVLTIGSILWFAMVLTLRFTGPFGSRWGLPPATGHGGTMPVLLALLLVHVILHECGHAVGAWVVGFEVAAFSVGPVVLWKRGASWKVKLQAKLFEGYLGARAVSTVNLRFNECAMVAAGPAASLLAGLVSLSAIPLLSATWAGAYWDVLASAGLLGIYLFVINLIPLGYSDGAMLFHLILRTARGEELLEGLRAGIQDPRQARAAATTAAGPAGKPASKPENDPLDEVRLKRDQLRRITASGTDNLRTVAAAHFEAGRAELAADLYLDAEANLKAGLDLAGDGPKATRIRMSCWNRLHQLYRQRQNVTEERRAYAALIATLQQLIEEDPDRAAATRVTMSSVHLRAGDYAAALATAEAALPAASRESHRASLLHHRAACQLQLTRIVEGLESALEAATLFIGAGPENCNAGGLAALGSSLWNAGREERGTSYLSDAIRACETQGDKVAAQRYRLVLADCLMRLGRFAPAASVLPSPLSVTPGLKIDFHRIRGGIRLRSGQAAGALADCNAVLTGVERLMPDDEIAHALAWSNLASAHEAAGNLDRSRELAAQALARLDPPERATNMLTLGIVGWRKQRFKGTWVEGALDAFEAAPFLSHANRARTLEHMAHRLENAGLGADGQQFRSAAARHWRILGLTDRAAALTAGAVEVGPDGAGLRGRLLAAGD